jgi:CBS domain containing-hemolysin-like protein
MIPRSDIISVSYDISLEELSKTIIKYGHTRTLVYKDNLDNVIGFLHIKDLFEIIAKSKKYSLKKLMRKQTINKKESL